MSFSQYLKEVENWQDQLAAGPLGTISIGKLFGFATSRKSSFLKTIPVSKVRHDLSWWDGNQERMLNSDTSYPILVLVMPSGEWTVTDGLNRLKKAISIEKKKTINAYVIPISTIPKSVFV